MLKLQINRKLLPMKGHYFLWNAGTAPVVPFLSTYVRQLGFSSFIVGVMYTVMPFLGMVAKPLFGAIADRYRCQKLIFLTFIVVTAVGFLGIYYVPAMPVETSVHFACDKSISVIDTCESISECAAEEIKSQSSTMMECDLECTKEESLWNTICHFWNISEYCGTSAPEIIHFTAQVPMNYTEVTSDCIYFRVNHVTARGNTYKPVCNDPFKISTYCSMTCSSHVVNEMLSRPVVSDDNVHKYYEFWMLLIFMIISWVSQAIVVSVSDAVCFDMLENRPELYGMQRSYGALGWGLFSIFAGLMIDAFSESQGNKNYLSVFYLAVGVLIVDFLVSYQLKHTQRNISASILADVGHLLMNIRILVFMGFCIFVGMCTGLIWQFLFWLLEDLASAQGCNFQEWIKTLQGLVMAVQCLGGELPFFFLSGWIHKRIGHVNSMSLVLLVIGIRYIAYSIISNPWWFLPIELTNGLTFGLFYATMASYASIIAPPGTETTVQGLVGAVFEGIGVSLGSLIGGSLYNTYGGILTFRIFGIASLIVCLVHAFIQFILQRQTKDPLSGYATPLDAINMIGSDQRIER